MQKPWPQMICFIQCTYFLVASCVSTLNLLFDAQYVHDIFFITVPPPNVSVTALSTQTVGQSLTLQCEVTSVRGITSRVDIVWTSGGTELQRMNNVSSTMMSNSLVYTNSYTISQLNTTDDGRVIQCEAVINTSPSVMANVNTTLNVTGMFIVMCFLYLIVTKSGKTCLICKFFISRNTNLKYLLHFTSLVVYIIQSCQIYCIAYCWFYR